MADILFWNECKKTLERDLAVEEYSTWILPLMLKENMGIRPKSYSVLAPNEFILNWVEENYSTLIKDRLVAITSNPEVNISFEVNQVEEKTENEDEQTNIETSTWPTAALFQASRVRQAYGTCNECRNRRIRSVPIPDMPGEIRSSPRPRLLDPDNVIRAYVCPRYEIIRRGAHLKFFPNDGNGEAYG